MYLEIPRRRENLGDLETYYTFVSKRMLQKVGYVYKINTYTNYVYRNIYIDLSI